MVGYPDVALGGGGGGGGDVDAGGLGPHQAACLCVHPPLGGGPALTDTIHGHSRKARTTSITFTGVGGWGVDPSVWHLYVANGIAFFTSTTGKLLTVRPFFLYINVSITII